MVLPLPRGEARRSSSEVSRYGRAAPLSFFELYLHGLIVRHGYGAAPEENAGPSGRRPDFLVSASGAEFYLEAVQVERESKDQRARRRRLHDLFDA